MRDILEQLLRAAGVPNPDRVEELWAEYRAGGTGANAAFATLIGWYGAAVYRRIWGFVRSDAADDVFQEVLIRLHRERANLATFAHALRWFLTVASSRCVDAHRRERRRAARELAKAISVESTVPPDKQLELEEALRVGLSKLSAQEQEAVALVFFKEMTRQDAAAVVGVHRDTFAKLLDGALAKLRAAMAVVAVSGSSAVTVESALAARPPIPPARLTSLSATAWEHALLPAGAGWLSTSKVFAAVLLLGGMVSVSLAMIPRSPEMKTASPPQNRAHLGVERLETRDNPSGGLLDPTFGTNGLVTLPNNVMTHVAETAVQADGKIVTVGTVVRSANVFGSTLQVAVTRLNTNGTLDTSFGTNGTVKLAKGVGGRTIALQPDGKILVGADVSVKSAGSDNFAYAVARLNQSGTLDTTFGNDKGWWVANPTSQSERVSDLKVVPSGTSFNIYAAGDFSFRTSAGVISAGVSLIKLNANGQTDTAYGSQGIATQALPTGASTTRDFAVGPSGEAVVITTPGNPSYLVAFNPSGQLNLNFNGVGYLPRPLASGALWNVTFQGDKILVAAGSGTGQTTPAATVSRYTVTGTLDATFGTNGTYFLSMPLAYGVVFTDLALAADGSLALIGFVAHKEADNTVRHALLVGRISAEGAADTNFGTDGTGFVVRPEFGTSYSPGIWSLTLDSAGNYLIGGSDVTNKALPKGVVLRVTGS